MLERALAFDCEGERLYGVLSLPAAAAGPRGVLVVVGGPQYRAGSHRQFTLLARSLAARGIPAMRFDYRGMGDSEGAQRGFLAVQADLRAAIDHFVASVPGMREVVLWGLCDGATAAALYAPGDARVAGVALVNPWVRTESGAARATIRHYYRARLLDPALWKKIAAGRFRFGAALHSALQLARSALRPTAPAAAGLPEQLHGALAAFRGRVLVLLAGADLTAQEFAGLASAYGTWRALLDAPHVTRHDLSGADHTFSRRAWHDQTVELTHDWVCSW
jgi:exosortase A-associated hydrolase 1